MKKSLLLAILFFSCFSVFAQNELLVQSSDKGLYLNHTVAAKENFYSIGRLYNIPPKEIATLNGLDMTHGLNVGQALKIPLNENNFSQSTTNGRAIYYIVGQKEGLYRVSLKNNNVLMANLRKWNKLNKDNISTGQKLIVGYLVSSEAQNITVNLPQKNEDVAVADKKETVSNTSVKETQEPEKKEEVKKEPVPEKKQNVIAANNQVAVNDGNGGYFKSQFDLQVKSQPAKKDETASAGIFKTASGWADAKYYALIDAVEPGTIIKLVNPTNNKAVYAKVLGQMSGIRQNQGYDVRISNAAASALEVSDTDKFIVKLVY